MCSKHARPKAPSHDVGERHLGGQTWLKRYDAHRVRGVHAVSRFTFDDDPPRR
jgi:hypothetical protein